MHIGLTFKRSSASLANCIIALISLLTGFYPIFSAQADQENIDNHFIVLSYHDIQDELKANTPSYTVRTSDFINQLLWLREHGYHVISLQQILDAQSGKTNLPEKAVLLTFDDGYKSFHTRVFPTLKIFNYPAILALVGGWMEKYPKGHFTTGDENSGYLYQRQDLMSWDEVREVIASNLVEIASHSFDLHHGILANPQGNLQPAATAYQYLTDAGAYEADTEYLERIRLDLRKNSDLLRQRTGASPRAMVWPYGAYNAATSRLARELGMAVTFNLNDGVNTAQSNPSDYLRILMLRDTGVDGLIRTLTDPPFRPIRMIQVDLDYVYDPDPAQQEKNLSTLLDRVKKLNISTVYLQAFADADGDNAAEALYFPNRHMPMRADLFNRVAWQLRTRAGVKVYAWLPVLAFKLPREHPAYADTIKSDLSTTSRTQFRLSPFSERVRQTIIEIYEDLAKKAPVAGVLFHDDALLSDYEDANPFALSYYQNVWHLPLSIVAIREDPDLMLKWTALKIEMLDQFTHNLADAFKKWQPALKTARNIYARVILEPESERWFAQSYSRFLENYDYTAIMAMPYMEGYQNPQQWLKDLVSKVKETPGAINKSIFELQSRDWNTSLPIPSQDIANQLELIHSLGVSHFGYYPDDFIQNHPEFNIIFPAMTLKASP